MDKGNQKFGLGMVLGSAVGMLLYRMNDLSIVIRRATRDDAASIAEIQVGSWRKTSPGLVDQAYLDDLSIARRTSFRAQHLSVERTSALDVFLAVAADGRPVGFRSGGPMREPFPGFDGELHALYLREPSQRRGVGRRLIRE